MKNSLKKYYQILNQEFHSYNNNNININNNKQQNSRKRKKRDLYERNNILKFFWNVAT